MPEPLREIIDLINSVDEEVRSRGIERMALEGGRSAVPYLLSAMTDESLRLRNKARALMLQMDRTDVLPYLEDALRDNDNAGLRNAAMDIYVFLGKESLHALHRLLSDPDEEVRNFVCVLLGNIAAPESVPILLDALKDDDVNVCHAAAEALGKAGDARAVAPLIEALGSEDFWRLYPIITALGELGDERAVKPLIGFLDNELLGLTTVQALGRIASPTALTHILPLLGTDEPAVKTQALEAVVAIQKRMMGDGEDGAGKAVNARLMEVMGDHGFRAFLIGLLSAREASVKNDALTALGWLREDRAVSRMIDLIMDESLAQSAQGALTGIGLPALPEVVKRLKHPVGMVRQALVKYLGGLDKDRGAPPLREMLKDEMSIVRAEACLVLGRLGDLEAADDIIALLGDENPEVQEAAITALSGLDPQVVCRKLVPYLRNSDPQFMFLAAETLGLLRVEEAVGPLSALLDDPREIIREVAVKSLGRIGGMNAVLPLLMSLKDESQRVRQQAIAALGKIKDPLVLGKLMDLLDDPDRAVQYYAIRALKEQGSAASVPRLIKVLDGDSKNLLVAAVETLGSLGDPSACDALLKVAGTADRDLLRTAAQALGELGCQEATPTLLRLVGHDHWSVRSAAAGSLGRVGGADASEAVSGLLKIEEDVVVRRSAVTALGELGDRRAAVMLVPMLVDESLGRYAHESLLMLGKDAAADVVKGLEDAPVTLLLKGVRVLGHMADAVGASYLKGLLIHPEPAVRREAALALGRVGGLGVVDELRRVMDTDEEEIVRMAAEGAVINMPHAGA